MERIPVVTIEDRIEVTDELKDYFEVFIPFEEQIKRSLWQKITREGIKDKKVLVQIAMKEFSVSKRTANSIVINVKGLFNALKELTREQIKGNKLKAQKIRKKIKSLQSRLKRLDQILLKRPLTKAEYEEFKSIKSRLFQRQNRLNRIEQKIEQMELRVKTGRLKLCFGSRKLFKAQYYLKENGFNTHHQWLKAFRANRDKNVFYVGSKEELIFTSYFSLFYSPLYCFLLKLPLFSNHT